MPLTEQREKVDRDEVFLEYTKSICPVCKAVVDAEVNIRDNRVLLRKRCPDHGRFEALVYSDAELYMRQLRFNKPGTLPLDLQTEVKDGSSPTRSCFGARRPGNRCGRSLPTTTSRTPRSDKPGMAEGRFRSSPI